MRGLHEYGLLKKFVETTLVDSDNPRVTLEPYEKCAISRHSNIGRVEIQYVSVFKAEWPELFKTFHMNVRTDGNLKIYVVFTFFPTDEDRYCTLERLLDKKCTDNYLLDSIANHTFFGYI